MRRSKRRKPDKSNTEETIRELFPDEAIEKAKEVAAESDAKSDSTSKKGNSAGQRDKG